MYLYLDMCLKDNIEEPIGDTTLKILTHKYILSPMKILRKLPPLKAHAIIELAVTSCKELPPKLYENLVRHLYDERVAEDLGVQVAGISNTTSSVSQHQSNRYYRR